MNQHLLEVVTGQRNSAMDQLAMTVAELLSAREEILKLKQELQRLLQNQVQLKAAEPQVASSPSSEEVALPLEERLPNYPF